MASGSPGEDRDLHGSPLGAAYEATRLQTVDGNRKSGRRDNPPVGTAALGCPVGRSPIANYSRNSPAARLHLRASNASAGVLLQTERAVRPASWKRRKENSTA